MNNEEALKQLNIEIPEGYEFIKYDKPQKDDYFINDDNILKLSGGSYSQKFLIVRSNIETECWYLTRDEEGDTCVMYLSDERKWMTYLNPTWSNRPFKEYKIISKMEVVK